MDKIDNFIYNPQKESLEGADHLFIMQSSKIIFSFCVCGPHFQYVFLHLQKCVCGLFKPVRRLLRGFVIKIIPHSPKKTTAHLLLCAKRAMSPWAHLSDDNKVNLIIQVFVFRRCRDRRFKILHA